MEPWPTDEGTVGYANARSAWIASTIRTGSGRPLVEFLLSYAPILIQYLVIDDYDLNRYQNTKLYLGRWELNSKTFRGSVAQHLYGPLANMGWNPYYVLFNIMRVIHCTYTSAIRRSKKGEWYKCIQTVILTTSFKYLKLGDFSITVVAQYSWHVEVALKNFKV